MTRPSSLLQDTQSQTDRREIAIDRVGVKRLKHPIEVADRSRNRQSTVATLSLSVDLPQQFKGTHMSRFVEAINAHGRLIHVENIPDILRDLRSRLHAETAHVVMEFPYFIEKKAPISGAAGLMDYLARFDASMTGNEIDLRLGVQVPVTTLCPCSRNISERGAHNQRGIVDLDVMFTQTVWIEELITMVEASASSELYSLLKRPDEKFVTERAYDNPVFVEDLSRNVALRCRKDSRIVWFRVEVENFESIHNHSAYAVIEEP